MVGVKIERLIERRGLKHGQQKEPLFSLSKK